MTCMWIAADTQIDRGSVCYMLQKVVELKYHVLAVVFPIYTCHFMLDDLQINQQIVISLIGVEIPVSKFRIYIR